MQEEWWYVAEGNTKTGPASVEALRQLLLEERMTRQTLVWKEGCESWTPLAEIDELRELTRNLPPELPETVAQERSSVPLHDAAGKKPEPAKRAFGRVVAAIAIFALVAAGGIWYVMTGPHDAQKQFELGFKYATGDGVPKDDARAAEWYKKAADQGYAEAQAMLGFSYLLGNGVIQDQEKGCSLIRLAAEQGDKTAIGEYNLFCARK
ncbi:MAG: GYF domain-containing protein [Zoogloeaceae bacterium]|jgi:hypothetical protein|nr:GYF domain-containing protein [Zoogloeaceae bacterium]